MSHKNQDKKKKKISVHLHRGVLEVTRSGMGFVIAQGLDRDVLVRPSDFNTAMMTDNTGRHLVMMPHLERSTFPWNWAYYPKDRKNDKVSPWVGALVDARKWIEKAN